MKQLAHKVMPSVATNNRMVRTPSETAPLSALSFASLVYKEGAQEAMKSFTNLKTYSWPWQRGGCIPGP